MQIARLHIDIIAKCNPTGLKKSLNLLFLLIFFRFVDWHAGCITYLRATPFKNQLQTKVSEMNMTLSLLNAAALVALIAFHFQDGTRTESVAVQAQPHYLIKSAPRYAAMPAQHAETILTTDNDEAVTVDRSERWVF
ncbi:hypothetical protein ACIPL1_13055 [Pseudomonas sp. NPDC090202]|uniref:hypothetical protein n=1 Tax=unclassified Pseudomonas TaxID=196821 RepID=UPI0037F51C72